MKKKPVKKNADKSRKLPVRRKETEFETFLKIHSLENDEDAFFVGTLTNEKVAEALGISPETISEWKKDPRYIATKKKALQNALRGMQRSGGDDRRMWRELAKINGIEEESTLKQEHSGIIGTANVDIDKLPDDNELAKLLKKK